ncbi:MAG TPA: insulinase family protein [Thermoanaerobaculia bacterium]|jgi:zinc protease|nr:insulinase family protein [Thermoanaerobaculia bacterium]
MRYPKLLPLLLCLLAAVPVIAQAPAQAPAPPATAENLEALLPLDPEVTIGKLPNGLTYYIRKNTVPAGRAEIWLVVNAGSVLEDEDQRGLAHLVEHMAFNGSQAFEHQDLVRYLESIGMRFGADVNAYTGFDETVYTLTVPTDRPEYVEQSLRILKDWADGLTFDPEELAKERGVVVEEWRLGRGASARMDDQQFPILFQGSRYAERLPIGQKEILEKATPEALRRFYNDWYRPDLMAVVAVGDFEPARIEQQISKQLGVLKNPGTPRPREIFPVPTHQETLFSFTTDPEATDTSVAIHWKQEKRREDRIVDYRRSIVEALYHAMLNQRLDEIAQRPDPPFLWGGSDTGRFVRSAEVTSLAAGVRDGEVERGLEALLTEVERVRRHGFTPGELERAKKEWLLGYEQAERERGKIESTTFADEFVRAFTYGESVPGIPTEVKMVRRFLPGITLDEVNHLADEWLTDHSRVVLVKAPKKEGIALPSEDRLRAVFATAAKREVEPYVDRAVSGPLVAAVPKPGTIIRETKIKEIGVTEWRLSNGVRVLLKPTDFKNDEILLTSYSPGGHSLVPDAEFPSALFATALIGEAGFGQFDSISLEKALAGKSVQVGPYIAQLEEGVEGGSSVRDLETLLQLVYLSVTAPRQDEAAFRSVLDRMRAFAENRLADPGEVFNDAMMRALTQGNPRWQPISPELIGKVDPAVAWRIYHDRFADAGDFTFLLVGSFKPEAIKPLVQTWLGGLPSQGRKETWKDVGVRPPDGVVEVKIERGLEPKSQVQIVFTGDAPFSRVARHDISSLSDVLDVRLREVLREDMGAVYGVQVNAGLDRRPEERYTVTVAFGCAPEQVQALVKAVFTEIEAIQKTGIGESYVKQVQEKQRRERETNLKTNEFWLAAMEAYDSEGLDLRDLPRYDELVQRVSTKTIQDAARRYLRRERYVLGVLDPEKKVAK